MYKFMNNPYVRMPFFEADKGGGAGGSGEDGSDTGEGDDPDGDDDPDEDGEDEEEKKFSQKDIDEAVKKRLAREKRKWQRDQQKQSASGVTKKETDPDNEGDIEADKKVRKAEERAAALEMKWTCLEHDVKKDCVDDVLALAKVHMAKDEDMDVEDAIDAVLKKYPQFKDGYDEEDTDGDQGKKGWGQRHGKPPKKENTVEDEIRKQMFGK